MGTQLAANIISIIGLFINLILAIVAFCAISSSKMQAKEDWRHAQQLAREERQHQGRPVLVPISDISNFAALPNIVESTQKIIIQNIGNGASFNVHSALYFPNNNWYSSWNNGPISTDTCTITLDKGPDNIKLGAKTSVDGKYSLYNGDDPNYRAGRLTMTYRDLFNIQHVSVFDYIVPAPNEYRWVQLTIKDGIEKDLEDLDNEKVRSSRRIKPTY